MTSLLISLKCQCSDSLFGVPEIIGKHGSVLYPVYVALRLLIIFSLSDLSSFILYPDFITHMLCLSSASTSFLEELTIFHWDKNIGFWSISGRQTD